MVELPDNETNEQKIVTQGYFEREVRLSASATSSFLRDLADQIDDGSDLTISSDKWEIPFQFREPIEVEIEFIGDGKRELEVELEFEWDSEDDSLNVN
ncbi:amphi-Trp domain-containing protein [Haladaptatus sp. CMAA 1911]|uniref:amphi-Trp domain-containing protein n=1 Tax=unclassified Haladaptatus TaxID=2622732 RepID=UPI0037543101